MGRKRTLPDYECTYCKTMFRPRYAVAKYCSVGCRAAALSGGIKKCLQCSALFKPKYGEQRYCSHDCSAQSMRADKFVTCQWCSTQFERPHGKPRAFCSRSCSMKARNAGLAANYAVLNEKPAPAGFWLNHAGYVVAKIDGRQVLQHRLVMEQVLGRPLLPTERVHHKNGDRQDNRPENLELWTGVGSSKKDPHGVRVVDKVLDLLDCLTDEERKRVLNKLEAMCP